MNISKLFIGILLLCTACQQTESPVTLSGLSPKNFEAEVQGKKTGLYVLKNKNNMEVCITNYGGRIVSVMVPDRDGVMRDVVLGFDSIQDYIKYPTDFGATIGRYANRIANGRFKLDDVVYQLPLNNFGHCLHGGPNGFQYRVFDAQQKSDNEIQAIDIKYEASTDKPTIVNMTNHSYFNLDGDPTSDNGKYLLQVNGDYFTPVDSTFMTTGEILSVEGTPFDFRNPTALGERFTIDDEQLKNGKGIDHNWVLNTKGNINVSCARLKSEKTGITMDVYTTEPGIQVYTGNFLDGTLVGKKGIVYNHRASVCLETQKYPDTPNKADWPSAVLRPGEVYRSQCIYKFSIE